MASVLANAAPSTNGPSALRRVGKGVVVVGDSSTVKGRANSRAALRTVRKDVAVDDANSNPAGGRLCTNGLAALRLCEELAAGDRFIVLAYN
jgi:hypothetical protein